ncbi:MAG: PocR ligand-binding domain-containing protein [Candidatus Desulfofervidaceae bacterium]|nr:PocR ligand-binding domain-containing protein [Candidatus Desulfofervidaceae bacterium]
MQLTDVLPVEKWQQLAEEIHAKYGMNGAVSNNEGFIIHPNPGWANEICPLIKGNSQSRVVCASAQQNMMKQAREQRVPILGECDVGFSKFIVPIFYQNEFLGTAGGCGFLLEGNEIDVFYAAKLLGKTEGEIEKLLPTVKKFSKEEIKEAIEYVKKRLEEIIQS